MRAFVLLTSLLLAPCAFSAKHAITHEDVWLMPRVGSPAISPDGKWVVVGMGEPSYDDSKAVSDLWIVPADGSSKPRRLTFTKGGEGGVTWSPDSRRIAFVAKREGDDAAQIYVLPIEGGEAIRITRISSGASDPQWSPDGKRLLFQTRVYPGVANDEDQKKLAEQRKARKYNMRSYDSLPIRRWDKWIDDLQRRIVVQDAEPGAAAKDLLAGSELIRKPGFAGVEGGTGDDSLQAVWAPDGNSVVFAATENRNVAAYAHSTSNIYQVSLTGGEPKRLTEGPDSYDHPKFRPDGKALYMGHSVDSNKRLYSLNRLARLSWPSPASPTVPQVITGKTDRSVDSYVFTPDSKAIYFTAEEHGHDKLFMLPAEGGDAKLVYDMRVGGYGNLDIAEKAPVIVANFFSMINPSEVVRIDLDKKSHQALTAFSEERASQIDWQEPRHFWFQSKTTGQRIHNMLVLPPNFSADRKYPLMVFMHGGPHNMWKDMFFLRWNYHYLASPGYVVLMTNYTGSTGFGEEFADAINKNVLRGPAAEINEAADEAIRLFPFIDASQQFAGGASYGGYLSNWMEATTTRYKVLFTHAGLTNNESMWGATDGTFFWEQRYGGPAWERKSQWAEQNPFNMASNFKTPMIISHGEQDFRVPINQAFEIFKELQRQRIPSKLLIFPEENHWILRGENNKQYFQELFAWIDQYLNAPQKGSGLQ